MENGKQVGYSSSSFTNDLFGSKESVQSPASSGTISSLFPPPSVGLGTRSSIDDQLAHRNKHYMGNRVGDIGIAEEISRNREAAIYCASNREGNPIFNQKSGPCPLSSSLYYGGQEDMYVRSSNTTNLGSYQEVKKRRWGKIRTVTTLISLLGGIGGKGPSIIRAIRHFGILRIRLRGLQEVWLYSG